MPESVPWILGLPAKAGLAVVEMVERLAQWGVDVRTGGAGQDDAVFRWILGVVAWSAAAWAGWWLYAHQRTLVAFLPAGVLLAANAYYYWDGRFWLPLYLGMLTLVAVLTKRYALERRWQTAGHGLLGGRAYGHDPVRVGYKLACGHERLRYAARRDWADGQLV